MQRLAAEVRAPGGIALGFFDGGLSVH